MTSLKDNLDILDEHNMKDVWMHECVVYSGDTALINDQTQEPKIPSLLAAAVIGLNNTATPSPNISRYDDIWTDIDAQEVYLNAKPTCYLILGKSGTGAYTLGEAFAKKYNCIHLCPKNIINDEILQGSTTGKCLDFNMKHNNECTYGPIIHMLKQKIRSPAVQHRGYVISGFPLVPSDTNPYSLIKSKHSEEALYNADEILFDLIYNLKRKKPKPTGPVDNNDNINEEENNEEEEEEEEEEKKEEEAQEEGAEEEEIAAELPKFILNRCSGVFYNIKTFYETKQAIILEQLHELFNLDLQPDVIIYITCPDADVVTKKRHKYINYKTSQYTIDPFLTKVPSDLRWPAQYVISDYENPHANYVFHPKYNCRPPLNFTGEIEYQLCNYRKYVLPYIEQKIMDFDTKYVIKLDGRTSTYQMMHQITERILLMDVNPVILPEPLYLSEPSEDFEEFWESVNSLQVIHSDVLNFNRYPSLWYNRCPVELKRRQSVIGKPKYAVMMFKHVYLMSSLNNFITFCRNPRPFLKLTYLEPTCRIIVTGTKSAGKTMIAECLSWIFDTPVTSFDKILEVEKQKKYQVYAKRIYSEIVPVVEDARYSEWQKKEQDREASLQAWNHSILKDLKKYLPLLLESLKYVVKETPKEVEDEKIQEADEQKEEQEIAADEEKKVQKEESPKITEEVTKEQKEITAEETKDDNPEIASEEIKQEIAVEDSKEEQKEKQEQESAAGENKYEEELVGEQSEIKVGDNIEKEDQVIEDKQEKEEKTAEVSIIEEKDKEVQEKQQYKNKEAEEKVIDTKKEKEKKPIKGPVVREVPKPDPAFLKKFNTFRMRLSFLPVLDNVEECKAAIASESLSQYAPPNLTTETKKPLLPRLGDEDVKKAISEYITVNELQKELEPTVEEYMNEIIKLLSATDSERRQKTNYQEFYGKFIIDGFPSDPECWEYLSKAKLTPDYTIAIIENKEVDPDLILYYLDISRRIKNYHEVLFSVKDPLVLCKLQTKKNLIPKRLDIEMILNDLLYDGLRQSVDAATDSKSAEEHSAEISPEMISSFTESIEKFRENWDTIKIKLEETSKHFIEIEIENKSDVEILEEVLLNIRKGYFIPSEAFEDEEVEDDENGTTSRDLLTYNNPQNLCEANIYCPYSYFNYGLLWEGKREFALKHNNKVHYFAKEEFLEQFQKDITKYQAYNNPFKKLPRLKICVIGCSGSGLSALSKRLAMELGLIHIHFADIINYYYMPRHYKNVGRKYENPFTDEPMEEEGVVEFQMDEENPHLLADIFSNEKELRRIVYSYYERGQPILPMIMHKIIKSLWYTEPFNNTGFVLDGYPRLPQDVEDLIHCNCIPDIVIEIESNADIGVERIGPLMFNQWKTQLKEAKEAHKKVIETQQQSWMSFIMKKAVVRLIIEEIFDNCVGQEAPQLKKESISVESFVFDAHPTGSTNVDPKLFQIYNELVEEYPMPKDTREWEKAEDVREQINARIEAICETEYENIQALKDLLADNKINTITIDGSKPFTKVFRRSLSKLKHLRNRSQSFLEQTYIINTDIAELLLSQGFCFLSKFCRLCPVYMHENAHVLQNTYKISRRKGQLFPIIHRVYIYFVCGENNVKKFRKNPLKYITSFNIKSYHPYTLKIGIIGAPKSGKSTLAAKLARQYNLICISRGMALRSVLETMHWTELGANILKKLSRGDIVDTESVMNAVQTVAIDHRTVTYGFVLDGFPSTPYEAMLLTENGLYPIMIFDISSGKSVILENSQNEIHYDILKYMPPYSYPFIEHKFTKWNEESYKIRNWVKSDYDNIYSIDGNRSKWQCLHEVNNNIKELRSAIHSYLANVGSTVVPVKVMAISNALFEKKMSSFKNLCPACLRKNTLRHSGYPVDKKGVVQYRNQFYWICTEHMEVVKKFPDYYLDDDLDLPEVPAVVTVINPHNVYENGICIVTYAENLPSQILERGSHKFAAAYKSKTYLFCSETCLNKFLEKPDFYSDITVFKGSSWYPKLSLKNLPDLGYLEQTLANILTEACCSVNAERPKYPGLSIELSALIHIALYLKTHNPRLPKDEQTFYKKALKMFENRSKLILAIGLRMRSMENPFISYPTCHHGPVKQYSPDVNSVTGLKTASNNSSQSRNYDKSYATVGHQKGDGSSTSHLQRSSVAYHDDDDISLSHKYYASLSSMKYDI